MAELFALLRTEPQHVAQDILRKIREGLDVRSVLEQLNYTDRTEDMTDMFDLADPTLTATHNVPLQLREDTTALMPVTTQMIANGFVDTLMPPALVSSAMQPGEQVWPGVAQRWTRLTNNDQLVSHLIHMYYEHQQWVCDFNNRQLFLGDFARGLDDLCSEILVNAILANGCVSCASRSMLYRHSLLTSVTSVHLQ